MLAQSRLSPQRACRLLMPDGPHPDGPAGPGGRVYPGWPAPVSADGRPPVLDLGFDSGTLHTVRAQMRACVSHAGFPEGQAEDVVLAVHELAANAVSHGGGAGRLKGGRHIKYADKPSIANLLVTLMDKMDVPVEHVGGSTGKLVIDPLSGI